MKKQHFNRKCNKKLLPNDNEKIVSTVQLSNRAKHHSYLYNNKFSIFKDICSLYILPLLVIACLVRKKKQWQF